VAGRVRRLARVRDAEMATRSP